MGSEWSKQYNELFTIENTGDIPQDENGSTRYNDFLNPDSCVTLEGAKAEPALADAADGERFQFVRCGYYCKDTKHPGTFNRIVKLKDSFPKK